ncbi:Glycosyl transferase family 2 [Legionella birminghamensis]|uniref:Glycosyl transferase family 2 n=1 Tax=Legionella birminghamensis TaxID=28083 RepID=A0A378I9W2_9GAMM|nr:glycosyltransferase family 2 protein [Legionella birminghamensis]KTC69930.1 Glycosyl transferase family 2 [Legionella birminghamensis]STX31959.1 poly-beta-1,6 N-acetyl-D-glucosamine synthase [Legionella birminghamensis]
MDWRFIKSIFDLRELIFPLSFRKLFFFLFYALLIGAVVAVESSVGFFDYLIMAVKSNLIPLMAILYGFEPLLTLTSMAFTRYPPKEPEAPVKAADQIDVDIEAEQDPRTAIKNHNKGLAVIIVAHNSEAEIEATLRAYLKIVEPEQIFVIDNGNSELPADNTLSIVKSVSESIHYHWHNRGNKTIAQFVGLLLAFEYSHVLMSDDDVRPPPCFRFTRELLSDSRFKAIFYPIMAISNEEKPSKLVQWQSLEYKQADHYNMFEASSHGALYPHGAIALWDRLSLIKALLRHSTRFIAEDIETGIRSARLGYRHQFDSQYIFPTLVPKTILGPRPNLYAQRVRGWSMGIQTLNLELLWNFLTEWNLHPADVSVLKVSQLYMLYNNWVDWTRLAVMIISASDATYWGKLGAIIAGQQLTTMLWHYVKLRNRPDLQHDFFTLTSMFFYRLLQIGFTNFGLIRLLAIYLPNLQPAKTIEEQLKDGEFTNLQVELPEFLPVKKETRSENKPGFKESIYSFFCCGKSREIKPAPAITVELVEEPVKIEL